MTGTIASVTVSVCELCGAFSIASVFFVPDSMFSVFEENNHSIGGALAAFLRAALRVNSGKNDAF